MLGTISHFRVLEKVGEGGMAVVYRAEDIDLRRSVALKFITRRHLDNQEAFQRFIREAQTAASLNHPNICVIHEVGQVTPGDAIMLERDLTLEAGTPFIAMEFLEGLTLSSHLESKSRLDPSESLRIALPVAEGLSAAHSDGVVHRDLNPKNVMLIRDGRVKVLDFGLARCRVASGNDEEEDTSDTTSVEITAMGTILGTVAYLSPEQAVGEHADARSDVFSFGIMLYQMVAGTLPFKGSSRQSTIARILTAEPRPLEDRDPGVPPGLARVVRRCLRKRPEDRFNDTRDLVVDLREAFNELSPAIDLSSGEKPAAQSESPKSQSRLDRRLRWMAERSGRWVLLAAAALLVAAGFVVGRVWNGSRAVAGPQVHKRLTFTGAAGRAAISPDGAFVAYVDEHPDGEGSVMVRDLAGGAPVEVYSAVDVDSLQWSPDGSELLVAWRGADLGDETAGGTAIVPRLGGTPIWMPFLHLADWSNSGARIATAGPLPDEVRIVDRESDRAASHRISGDPVELKRLDWAPSEKVLVLGTDADDRSVMWTLDVDAGSDQKIYESREEILSARWGLGGSVVYFLAVVGDTNELRRLAIDSDTGRAAVEAQVVTAGTAAVDLAVPTRANRIVLLSQATSSNLWVVDVGNRRPAGDPVTTMVTSGRQFDSVPRFSPDGLSIVFTRGGSRRTSNVFTLSLTDGRMEQVTYLECSTDHPVWSPDGDAIAFVVDCGGDRHLWTASISGGVARRVDDVSVGGGLAWSPGDLIAFPRRGNRGLTLFDPMSGGATFLMSELPSGSLLSPQFSPDGRTVAVAWNRETDHGVWAIALDGASERPIHRGWLLPVRWSADGKSLFAHRDGRTVYRVPVEGGEAELLVTVPFDEARVGDVSPDGSRVLVEVHERTSDVWLVENFDVGAEGSPRESR